MGKRILQRRRGKGGMQFRVPPKGKIAPVRYPNLRTEGEEKLIVKAILDERGRTAPLAQLEQGTGEISYIPAVSGLAVGSSDCVSVPMPHPPSETYSLSAGSPRGRGFRTSSSESGDGGKLVRASGGSAVLFSKGNGRAILRLPSGKSILVDDKCRASIGEIAGGGQARQAVPAGGPPPPCHEGRREGCTRG